MRIQNKIVLGFVVAMTIASAAAARRRIEPAMPADTKVGVAITLQVAGQPYRFEGKAECLHASLASIYGVVSEVWSVRQSDGQKSITLTLWRPRSKSGDMFSLSVATGGKSYLVSTVSAGESKVQGSGKATFMSSGAGGTFTINATAANGAVITGTIKCSAFAALIAEGGN